MAEDKSKKVIDWELVEKHYRANIKTLRQIGEEYGVSHVSIMKRAKTYGWSRDLAAKIQQKAQELVTKRLVTKTTTKEKLVTDAETVQAYGEVVASVDMMQREDIGTALTVSRSQMTELAALGNPSFKEALEWLAETFDKSDADDNGREKVDKQNELYRYIISLPGRVKMSKDIGASHGVYIPLQRKVFGLDGKDSTGGSYEEMLRSVGQGS